MPRLALGNNGAGKNRKTGTVKSAKKFWTREEEHRLISKDKIEILNLPQTNIYWIGGKDAGKSRPVVLRGISLMEENYRCMLLSLKKYKSGGIARLHIANQNIALEIKRMGFDIPDYDKGINETFRMKNKRKKHSNQTIEYGSFDDANGLAGIEAKNLGFFGQVHIEEPVLIDDEGKLPTKAEWDAAMSTIKKSVARSNRKYIQNNPGLHIDATKYHYTMNPWDDHPIIDEAQIHFPEEEFLEWVKEDYLNHHTKFVVKPLMDSVYVRLTTLANPIINTIERVLKHFDIKSLVDWQELDKTLIDWSDPLMQEFLITKELIEVHIKGYDGLPIWFQIEEALRTNNSLLLASFLGLKFLGTSGNAKTYNLSRALLQDTEEILANRDNIIQGLSAAWDIDLRKGRRFVFTPIYLVDIKLSPFNYETKVIIGKQQFIQAYGDNGDYDEYYIKKMMEIHLAWIRNVIKISGRHRFKFGPTLYLDENKRHFLYELQKQNQLFKGMGKAKKHGRWDIMTRQDNVQAGIDTGFYIFDKDNIALLADLKRSYIKEGSKKRDETGKNEKHYDCINSMEYALYPFRLWVYKGGKTC